jgi:hypothetical protein
MSSRKVAGLHQVTPASGSVPKKTSANVSLSEPLFVDIQQAARILGFTVWAVRNIVWNRDIRYVKRGRKYFFSPGDLKAYAEKLLAESEVA